MRRWLVSVAVGHSGAARLKLCLMAALRPLLLLALLTQLALQVQASGWPGADSPPQTASLDVVINEIAWMGAASSPDAEWIELYNNTDRPINLSGWSLRAADGTPAVALSGIIPPAGYFLLERNDDNAAPAVPADLIYTGALWDGGEDLRLQAGAQIVDRVNCSAGWFAGHAAGRVPMARVNTRADGSQRANWTHNPRCGSATNAAGISHTCTLAVAHVGRPLDYAVYFNPWFTAAGPSPLPTPPENQLLALVNSATSQLDVALYGLNRQSVINALIAAHQRGIAVRVVGDDEAATGEYASGYQALSAAGIPVVTDASMSQIQHNKFLISDGQVVWTGSANVTDTCLTLHANNSIVITDTTLAGVYATEFAEMWSGRFHNSKADDTAHLLDYNGTLLESYFSPTDLVAFEVWDELARADQTIHFAMFFWTDDLLTARVIERLGAGVQVYGVWDQLGAANAWSADEALCAAGARIKIENFVGKVHHKFAVVDVAGSDPVVILGSYNWTDSGAYDNDENTLIVHDAALAQAYYAEWQRLWDAIGQDRICKPFTVRLPLVTRNWSSPANVRITFIDYDPPGNDVEGEYVQITNAGGTAADMTNWTLRDDANRVFTFPPFILQPGATVKVWTKAGTNTLTDLYWGSSTPIWTNTGDCAYLRDADGKPVDTYCY